MKKALLISLSLLTTSAYGVETKLFSLSKEVAQVLKDDEFNDALSGKGREEFVSFLEKNKKGTQASLESITFTIDEKSKFILLSSFFELFEQNLMWSLAHKFNLQQDLSNVLQLRLIASMDAKNETNKVRVEQEELAFAQNLEKRTAAISDQEKEKIVKDTMTELCDLLIKKIAQ